MCGENNCILYTMDMKIVLKKNIAFLKKNIYQTFMVNKLCPSMLEVQF